MSIPLTQNEAGVSKIKYAWAILFANNINFSCPFSIVPLSFFKDSDFPFDTIRGEMHSEDRAKIRTLQKLPGNEYRVFGKIEMGK